MLQCSFCAHRTEVRKAESIPQELETFSSRGWRYLSCPRCQNGFLKIYVKTKTGRWRFMSKTLYAEAIGWRPHDEPKASSPREEPLQGKEE
ncbi:MAG: hypothetical protein NWE76_05010 [Candidatus Bathyarchaeota archaeon]|jgi:hypothetical protein|nr:hypothetical protein [Candidatus Bathyarchaeota archaeon]